MRICSLASTTGSAAGPAAAREKGSRAAGVAGAAAVSSGASGPVEASGPAGAVVAVVTVKRISDRRGGDSVAGGAEGRSQGGVQAMGPAIGEDLGLRQTRQGQISQ